MKKMSPKNTRSGALTCGSQGLDDPKPVVSDDDENSAYAERRHRFYLVPDERLAADGQKRLGILVAERLHARPATRRQNGPLQHVRLHAAVSLTA